MDLHGEVLHMQAIDRTFWRILPFKQYSIAQSSVSDNRFYTRFGIVAGQSLLSMEKNSAAQTVGCLLLITHLLHHFRSPLSDATSTDCPSDCVCVNASRHVTCDGIGLTAIPVALLPIQVTSLDLSRNRLVVVDTLRGLGGLVELRLAQNNIRVLHRGALDYVAASLEVLDLSENNLTTLEPGALNVATGLLHVDLSGNQLRDVDGAFAGLQQLSRLDLRQNRLTAVTSSTFSGLSGLRYLRLDDNHISTVDSRAFDTLDRLMYLVLRGNQLGAESRRFHFSSGLLSYVDLSDCGLERFPAGLPGSVRYLQLRHNRLQTLSVDDLVDVAAELNILVLDENHLEHIDNDAFRMTSNLQQLWLNGNRLRSVPRSLPIILQRLFIDSNQLESLTVKDFPPPASGVWQLKTLSAMSNNISFVGGDALANLFQLTSLDLAANRIRKLYPDTFAGNMRLRVLTLSKNPLEEFGARCMKGLDELQTLSVAYISSAEISLAEDAFGERLPGLRKLDLTNSPALVEALLKSDTALSSLGGGVQDLVLLGSELETFSQQLLDVFPRLAVLHLSSNRWRCDAAVLWFRNWLLSESVHLEPSRDRIICASPRHVRGHALISLTDEDLQPVDGAQRSVRRRRPPPPLVLSTSSTSSVEKAATSSPTLPTWQDFNRMPLALHDDVTQLYRLHPTTRLRHGELAAPTTSGLTIGTSTNDRVMLVIAMTVLVTVLAAVVILVVIVYTCRKQPVSAALPMKRKETTRTTTTGTENASAIAENGCVASKTAGRRVIYFVASGNRSPNLGAARVEGSKSSTVVEMSDVIDGRHRVTLMPEQNVNDKSSLRVYKWEDF